MARRRAKVYDANGNEVRNEHGDCVFANYDPDDTVRLCKEGGQYGRPEFRGWRYCSRAKHCAAAADFRDGDRDDFLVCKTHNQQSWKSKQRAKNKQHLVRTTKPTPRGPRTPKKGKATKTGRVEKAITPKKTKVTAGTTPKKAKKTKKEKSELFVSSEEDSNDEDGECETDVDMPTAHIPRRYPGPDDDAPGSGGMGGGMSGQLIAV
ncbi:hypothetical protein CKAH01_05577 [Colletotrichum kahawae]|uniref:Uncharacterized protein n=1 Tax=Colletotrichum kahawae TaxID=34407 RepID=A0AAE0D5P4_COLKA|nr:hypothetical protein CKAH01_05577 [Colletotrichum kahawae]